MGQVVAYKRLKTMEKRQLIKPSGPKSGRGQITSGSLAPFGGGQYFLKTIDGLLIKSQSKTCTQQYNLNRSEWIKPEPV